MVLQLVQCVTKIKLSFTCIDDWSQSFVEGKDPEFEFKKNIKNIKY